jgi:hypothetical protein
MAESIPVGRETFKHSLAMKVLNFNLLYVSVILEKLMAAHPVKIKGSFPCGI